MSLINLIGSLCSTLSFIAMVTMAIRRQRLQRQRQLIETALPSDRARLIEVALDRFGMDTKQLTKNQQAEIVFERLRQRSERFRWALIASSSLLILSLAAVLTAYAIREPAFYQIRVTVLGLDGRPTDNTQLRSSVDGVLKQLPGGWELEIPKAMRPASGHVTIWAMKEALGCSPVEVELGSDHTLTIELQLQRIESQVKGLVVDEANEAIQAARVFVVGFEEEATETAASGSFALNAHVSTGERVRLRAEKSGYKTRDQTHLAGRAPVTLVLKEE